MFKLLASLGTIGTVITLVGGLLGGSVLSGGLAYLYTTYIASPSLIANQKALDEKECTIKIMAAADAAAATERQRQENAADAAFEAYKQLKDEQASSYEATQDQLEQENADYEAKLNAAGRSCPLSDDDLEFLRK